MELKSVQWLKVVAVSLGVTAEEAVCVITEGGTVSSSADVPSKGEGIMGAADAMSWPGRHCTRGSWDNDWETEETSA